MIARDVQYFECKQTRQIFEPSLPREENRREIFFPPSARITRHEWNKNGGKGKRKEERGTTGRVSQDWNNFERVGRADWLKAVLSPKG